MARSKFRMESVLLVMALSASLTFAGRINASVIYEYTGTVNIAFEIAQGGSVGTAPGLEGSLINGFVEIADTDFLPDITLTHSELLAWEFTWSVHDASYDIDVIFTDTDFANANAGVFSLDSNREVDEWFWNGQDSNADQLCVGCFGFGNTQHKIETSVYDVRGVDGNWTLSSAVPIPASLPLLASGLAGLLIAGRKKRRC